jgi:drug/metabolite transporter (DMT)-like permease
LWLALTVLGTLKVVFPLTDDTMADYPKSFRFRNCQMFQSVAILALVSAFFYCVAMFAMKSWAELPSMGLALIIGAALLTAGAFEVFALRQERLGLIYIGILGAEVIFLGLVSLLHFDETYTKRELAGMALVLIGTAIAWT